MTDGEVVQSPLVQCGRGLSTATSLDLSGRGGLFHILIDKNLNCFTCLRVQPALSRRRQQTEILWPTNQSKRRLRTSSSNNWALTPNRLRRRLHLSKIWGRTHSTSSSW